MSARHGLEPWAVDETRYPRCGPASDELRAALEWAVLAPSSHNSQPWLFDVKSDAVDVVADRTRALPVVDPHDRELTISVAAAAWTLALALRHFGRAPRLSWFPELHDPDLIARVSVEGTGDPSADDHGLFGAITPRCTNRGPFHDEPVPAGLLERLALAAAAEGAHLEFVEGPDRARLGDLVARADVMQMHDRSFRRELAAWTTANRSHRPDGLRGYSVGVHDVASAVGPSVIRRFDVGKGQAARDSDLAAGSPALAVLATAGDDPGDWAVAGAAMMAVWLRLVAAGYAASFLNQPIEVEPLREELAASYGGHGVPQLLLRLGRPVESVEHTPRRSASAVTVPESRWHHGMPDTVST